ncbi:MAG: YggS family pyridoxal phosphate-dependent enzyme [Flavobacteriales bacterium]|nr:YggS family pyridoxal phosphate-dependent enzyme [Flavobacteriales bacterium]
MSIAEHINQINASLPKHVTLVAVSKTKPNNDILEAYNAGQRIFGENKVQELSTKYESLPKDIEWHMIGHLQSNKVKYIAPFVSLIHGVDSFKLLKEIDKRAGQNNRTINCLLQVHIATEETKFGFSPEEITELLSSEAFRELKNVRVTGLMGMATFTENEAQIRQEFEGLHQLYTTLQTQHPQLNTLSMGMSGDYPIAVEAGSTMVRVGSSIFGERNYH